MQWLVLCGIPYRGSGALASPDPTNQLPTSLYGAGHKGHREAPLLISNFFESSTGRCRLQATQYPSRRSLACNCEENSNSVPDLQPRRLWETAISVGNSPSQHTPRRSIPMGCCRTGCPTLAAVILSGVEEAASWSFAARVGFGLQSQEVGALQAAEEGHISGSSSHLVSASHQFSRSRQAAFYAAWRTRRRSRSKPARPYMERWMSLRRAT
jgi:hypothetical protein